MMQYIQSLLSGPMSGIYIGCFIAGLAVIIVVGLVMLAMWQAQMSVYRLLQAHRRGEAMHCEEYNDK